MNVAAAIATGTWLLFLHADTELPAGWLEELRQITRTPSAGRSVAFRLATDSCWARVIERAVAFASAGSICRTATRALRATPAQSGWPVPFGPPGGDVGPPLGGRRMGSSQFGEPDPRPSLNRLNTVWDRDGCGSGDEKVRLQFEVFPLKIDYRTNYASHRLFVR